MPSIAAPTQVITAQNIVYWSDPYVRDLATGNTIIIGKVAVDGFEFNPNNATEDLTTVVNGAEVVTGFRNTGRNPQLNLTNLNPLVPGAAALHSARAAVSVSTQTHYYFGPFTIENDIMDFSGTNFEGSILVADEPNGEMVIWDPGETLIPTALTSVASTGSPNAGEFTQDTGGIFEFNAADYTAGSTQALFYVPQLTTSDDYTTIGTTVIDQVFFAIKGVSTQKQIVEISGVGAVRPADGPQITSGGINVTLQSLGVGCNPGFDVRWYNSDRLFAEVCKA